MFATEIFKCLKIILFLSLLQTIFNFKCFNHFKEFDDDRDASDAVYEMNGRELLGSR